VTGGDAALEGILGRLAAVAEASPVTEVCGFAVERADGLAELWPVPNTAADPRHAFRMDPAEVLRALRLADQEGRRLLALYHSHPSGGSSLSSSDLGELTAGGKPVLPGVELWVIALEDGVATEIRAHAWAGGGYAERCLRRRPFTV
jgi:proteasome lid subunit RPN8/RPN11